MGEDGLAEGLPEMGGARLVEPRARLIESIRDLFRSEGSVKVVADVEENFSDERIIVRHRVGRAAHRYAFGLYEDGVGWPFAAVHQAIEKSGGGISAATEVLPDARNRHWLVVGDKGIVADGEDCDVVRH